MSDSIEAQVRQIAADLFNTTPDKINVETSPQTVDNWDSVQHLNLVLAIESQMGVQFDPEEIDQMQNIGAIIELVRHKLSA